MAHTSLVLGANWGADEWPSHVTVSHEAAHARDGRPYVPWHGVRVVSREEVRTQDGGRLVQWGLSCGHSALRSVQAPFWCPMCGAEVVGDGD